MKLCLKIPPLVFAVTNSTFRQFDIRQFAKILDFHSLKGLSHEKVCEIMIWGLSM
jgi:hypothetical protein